MAVTRRSARLAQPPVTASRQNTARGGSSPSADVVEEKGVVRRPAASRRKRGADEAATKETKPDARKKAKRKAEDVTTMGESLLGSLSPEILDLILKNVTEKRDMRALGQTCKTLYSLLIPQLHNHLEVSAGYHAHIAKLIRALEPYLTVAQKKQLKKEGKYKGQQARYPTGLDEKVVPYVASYVRHMAVGPSDPGRKHRYIVYRYVEETVKNLENLEIFSTFVLTKSISESLMSMKSLKALSLENSNYDNEDMVMPLTKIANLKHLRYEEYGWQSTASRKAVQSIIMNSRSTLETLSIQTDRLATYYHLLLHWSPDDTDVPGWTPVAPQDFPLPNLRSLSLKSYNTDAENIDRLLKVIDFLNLEELRIGTLGKHTPMFFRKLAALASSSSSSSGRTSIKLRHLSIPMSVYSSTSSLEGYQEHLDATASLLSSFNTLETLDGKDCGRYREDSVHSNPGLADTMLHAILQHKNLKTLKFTYWGKAQGLGIPYLPAGTVGKLIDNLPLLQEFSFAPVEQEMSEIAQVLTRGKHLTTVTCFPYHSWVHSYPPPPDDPHRKIVLTIIKAFLNSPELTRISQWDKDKASANQQDQRDNGSFVWEENCRLKKVCASHPKLELASKFPKKRGKGETKPEQLWSDDRKRQVWYRDVPRQQDEEGDLELRWPYQLDGR